MLPLSPISLANNSVHWSNLSFSSRSGPDMITVTWMTTHSKAKSTVHWKALISYILQKLWGQTNAWELFCYYLSRRRRFCWSLTLSAFSTLVRSQISDLWLIGFSSTPECFSTLSVSMLGQPYVDLTASLRTSTLKTRPHIFAFSRQAILNSPQIYSKLTIIPRTLILKKAYDSAFVKREQALPNAPLSSICSLSLVVTLSSTQRKKNNVDKLTFPRNEELWVLFWN